MRIAVSGAHRTGKSTLIADLTERLPGYRAVDEPYRLMQDEGHDFADPPSLDDFVDQLRRSIQVPDEDRAPDLLFDRCPVDLLAYALTHEDGEAFDVDEWLPGVSRAALSRASRRWRGCSFHRPRCSAPGGRGSA